VTVDYLCNCFLPDRLPLWERSVADQGIPLKVADSFVPAADMVARMDDLGVGTVVLPTVAHSRPVVDEVEFEDVATTLDELRALADAHPGRFVGTWVVDPTTGSDGVRAAEDALSDPVMVGLYLHTHSFDRPFDHADYYPYYDLCGRLGVPMVVQAGSSGGRMPSECGKPIGIDRPAIYFRDTDFVLSHTGWPWVEEAVAMALKFSNVYLGTGSWPPAYWSPTLVDFIRRAGRRKVLFGTNFPTVDHRRALEQLDRLDLGDEARDGLLDGNARRVFRRLA